MITLSVNQIKNKRIHKGGTKMNMKKFTKRILAIVAAGVMTMGMAMPAFAAEPDITNMQKKPISARPIILRWERQRHLALLLHRLQRAKM